MTERRVPRFEVVRRGYDVDEVNAHLANMERQRSAELDRAQAVIRQKDAEIDRLRSLTAEVEHVQLQRAEVEIMMAEASRKRETVLEEASRAAREQTTLASKTAAGLRADTEKEMSALRRDTEAAMTELRSATRQEAERKLEQARTDARRIESEAEASAKRVEEDTLKRLAEFEANHQMELQHRSSQADRDHSAVIRTHRLAESELAARVTQLQAMLESLVGTLQSIAGGGLAAMDISTLSAVTVQANATEATSETDTHLPGDDESVTGSVFQADEVDEAPPIETETDPVQVDVEQPDTEMTGMSEDLVELAETSEDPEVSDDEIGDTEVDVEGNAEPELGQDESALSDDEPEVTAASAADTIELDVTQPAPATNGTGSRWRLISTP